MGVLAGPEGHGIVAPWALGCCAVCRPRRSPPSRWRAAPSAPVTPELAQLLRDSPEFKKLVGGLSGAK